jgi:hypothetical protein
VSVCNKMDTVKTRQPIGPSHAVLDLARPAGNGAGRIREYLNDFRHEGPAWPPALEDRWRGLTIPS